MCLAMRAGNLKRYHCSMLLLIFFVLLTIFPARTNAQIPTELPFGGWVVVSLPCTCTPGVFHVTYLLPYPLTYPWITMSINFTVATVRYSFIGSLIPAPVSTSWNLGFFNPAGAGLCWVGAPPFCTVVPADG